MSTDHIVHNANTQCMECQHCGFQQAVKMPAPIDDILAKMDAFTKAHEGCKAPASEAVMSEYIRGFDAGYDYVLSEIERFERDGPVYAKTIPALLAHLRMESKQGRETT
jgi:hypothetical protein